MARVDLDRWHTSSCGTSPRTADVVYNIPTDGTVFWLDTWVVLADAPHPIAAHAWLNFIQEPQQQALETETNQYATPNDAAKEFIDPKMLGRPGHLRTPTT